jgi:hypothetical protein
MMVRRRFSVLLFLAGALSLLAPLAVSADVTFADPRFKAIYYVGEAITTNFWGTHASEAKYERYDNNPGAKRLVQYFDKGRMEVTKGEVTFGLLATDMVTGCVQISDSKCVDRSPAKTPVAGDPGGLGPTYADIYDYRSTILAAKGKRIGQPINLFFDTDHTLYTDRAPDASLPKLTDYDDVTGHNVLRQFTNYRDEVGFTTIGYARSEPAAAFFTVGGVKRVIAFQVFERRVLTFTPDNPTAFQVEMGNIGQHYFNWLGY